MAANKTKNTKRTAVARPSSKPSRTKNSPGKKRKRPKGNKNTSTTEASDWMSSLVAAQQAEAVSSATVANDGRTETVVSKQERKRRRDEKKRRRDERKGGQAVERNATERNGPRAGRSMSAGEQRRGLETLDRLSRRIEMIVEGVFSGDGGADNGGGSGSGRRYAKPYVHPEASVQGKATAGQQLTETIIQPRKRDYGGLGLTRPSLLLSLRDHSFVPKLQEEFTEHVAGFFGKQRTKAMKKQLDGNMLWKRIRNSSKQDVAKNVDMNRKLDGKKLMDMVPDEKVEAMIKLGML